MATPYIGQIFITGFNFAPKNYSFCNGQTLSIQQNTALFSLLGTTYGGDGVTNFKLPDLRGRVPIHWDNLGSGQFQLGQVGGEEAHTLQSTEIPAHTHVVTTAASKDEQTTNRPDGAYFTQGGAYGSSADTALAGTPTAATGGSQPHQNLMPTLCVNFVIAQFGVFPSRN